MKQKRYMWEVAFMGVRPERPNLRTQATTRVQAADQTEAIVAGANALRVEGWVIDDLVFASRRFVVRD
jgi:hypothetical protein